MGKVVEVKERHWILRWLAGLFSSKGSVGRTRYWFTNVTCYAIIIFLLYLASVHPAFIALAVVVGLPVDYIDIMTTIKRLHDLGRSGSDLPHLLIPIVGDFLEFKLNYQSGETEKLREAQRDYNIQQFRRKHLNYKSHDDIYRDINRSRF